MASTDDKAPSATPSTPTPSKPTSKAAGTPAPDWERIELDYRAGVKSLREIAEGSGVSHVGISKRAKRNHWERAAPVKASREVVSQDQYDAAGFVYVVYLDDTAGERFFKIGMAASFTSRYQAHQCASPFTIGVACAYYTGNMRAEERWLHVQFAAQRVRGEWFRLSLDDLQAIASRAFLL